MTVCDRCSEPIDNGLVWMFSHWHAFCQPCLGVLQAVEYPEVPRQDYVDPDAAVPEELKPEPGAVNTEPYRFRSLFP